MTSPTVGFIFNQLDDDTLPPVLSDFTVLGIVLPSDDATASVFPLNVPVDTNTGDPTALAAMGTGPLYNAVLRINNQLSDLQRSARAIIVRVPTGRNQDGTENVAQTIANIVGDPAQQTGLYALLKAPGLIGATPRIIGAPGYTGQVTFGATSPVVTNEGSGYTNPVVTFSPAGATATATVGNAGVQATGTATVGNAGVQATGHATLGSGGAAGQVASIAVDNGGTTYRTAPAVTLTGGGGTGVTAHAVLTSGVVTSIVIDTAGTGYTTAPTVALAAPPTGQVTGVSIGNGGQDYASAPSVTLSGGGGTGATAHAVVANGVVTSVIIDNPGSGYTTAPAVAIGAPAGGEITAINLTSPGDYAPGVTVTVSIADANGGSGAGATATVSVEMLANPICAALPAVCNALLAHAAVGGPGTTKADAIAWRGTLNSQRLIPVDNWEIVASGTGDAYIDGAAAAMGCGVRTDFQHAGFPFWSWGNQPVQGLLGLKRVDNLSLLDGATDGQELLAAGIGITARGDLSDTSIDDSGFILCCFNNASSDPRYSMFNKTRGRDFTNLAIIKSCRRRLMKDNVTAHGIQAVLNDVTAVMAAMPSEGIVGWRVGFAANANTPDNLRLGKFRIFDDSEEAAPILQITVDRALDESALTAELAQIAASTSQVTG